MAETQFENIELPNGAILTEVPTGTSDEEIKAYALSSGMAVEEDFAPSLDNFMQDIPGFAEGDEVYAEKELEDLSFVKKTGAKDRNKDDPFANLGL